jgi:glycosyltransferase involved in cell wall biosynthesis
MHLVIQIPCFNEAECIGDVIRDLPTVIEGVSRVSILVIDDGSQDDSDKVALAAGADRVVRHAANRGLAAAYTTGIETALQMGADIIVNTDADGQYPARHLPALIEPIVRGEADIVIGDRRPHRVQHFSPLKRMLQWIGSTTLSLLMGRSLPDPVSGFRALSRETAERLTVTSDFSYTLETLIQAVQLKRSVRFVPIDTEITPRPSRLAKSIAQFITRSAATILRVFVLYYPLRSFGLFAFLPLICGSILIGRFSWLFLVGNGSGHVQSLVIGSLLVSLAFLLAAIGIVAEGLRVNRQLLQTVLQTSRRRMQPSKSLIPETVLAEAESNYWR